MSAWDDLGTRPRAETYAEALARCDVLNQRQNKPSADPVAIAAHIQAHDEAFADNYIKTRTGQRVSSTLMRNLGYTTFNSADDDKYDMGQMGRPEE